MEIISIKPNGIALDEFGHELRDEDGCVIIVPESEREFYDVICDFE